MTTPLMMILSELEQDYHFIDSVQRDPSEDTDDYRRLRRLTYDFYRFKGLTLDRFRFIPSDTEPILRYFKYRNVLNITIEGVPYSISDDDYIGLLASTLDGSSVGLKGKKGDRYLYPQEVSLGTSQNDL